MNKSRMSFTRFLSFLLVFTLLLTIFPAVAESPATPTDLYPAEETFEPETEQEETAKSDLTEDPEEAAEPEGEEETEPTGDEDPKEEATADGEPEEITGPFLAFLKAGARLYADKDCYRKQQILGEEAVVLVVKTSEGIGEILYAYENVQDETVPGAAFAKTADLRPLTEEETAAWIAAEHPRGIEKLDFPLEPVTYGTEPAPEQPGNEKAGSEDESADEETGDSESGDPESGDNEPEIENIDDSDKTEGNETEGDGIESDEAESDKVVGNGTESDGSENDGSESDGTESNGTEGDGAENNGAESDGTEGSETGDVSSVEAFIPGGEALIDILNQEPAEEDVKNEEPEETATEATPTDLAGAESEEPVSTDAGTPEAGTPDAGTPGAGTPGAGTPDTETLITNNNGGLPSAAGPADYNLPNEPETVQTDSVNSSIVYEMNEDGTMSGGYERKYDGRNLLPDTRNQNPFGSCWTFAAIGAMEIDLIVNQVANIDINLSELFLIYYTTHNYPYVEGGAEGDNIDFVRPAPYEDTGGFQEKAYRMLANLIGTVTETDAPYSHETTGYGDLDVTGYDGKIAAQIAGAYKINSTDRNALKQAIKEHGSVEVDIWFPENSSLYDLYDKITDEKTGAIYYSVYREKYNCLRGTYPYSNHSVLLVGWDDDYPASNFDWPGTNNGAWLVRNSWNATSSKAESRSTYFWLSYDDSSMKAGNATAYDAINNTNGKEIADYCYGYDRALLNSYILHTEKPSVTLRTSFTVIGNEKIQAVGVETGSDNQKISVSVKADGRTLASGQATAKYSGFYRIKLNDIWSVPSGTKVEVVVNYASTDGSNIIIPYEHPGTVSSSKDNKVVLNSTAGQGGEFYLDDVLQYGDPRVKLYTQVNGTAVDDPTRITLNKKSISLKSGDSFKLKATVQPSSAAGTRIAWCSSNESVAIVEQDGTVYGAGGTSGTRDAVITAIAPNGVSATCKVSVTMGKVPVTGIKIKNKPSSGIFTIDEKNVPADFTFGSVLPMKLDTEFLPKYPNNRGVTWKSSNTSVISVTDHGDGTCSLTIKKNGTATITVTAKDTTNGTKSDSVKINVSLPIPVTGIAVSPSRADLVMGKGYQLTGRIYPNNATNKGIVWTSSNTKVVTVNSSGYLTPTGAGTATITAASAENSNISTSCEVTVTIPVTGIKATVDGFVDASTYTIDGSKGHKFGSTLSLRAKITPANATEKGVTWQSSDASILAVTENSDGTCTLTIKKNGTASVTATAKDKTGGTRSDSLKITVAIPIPVTGIWIAYSRKSLTKGTGFQMESKISPADATNQKIIWSSSNTKVFTVNDSGYLTPQGNGKATLTAKSADNKNLSTTCEIIVSGFTVPVSNIWIDYASYGLLEGEGFQLQSRIYPDDATNKKIIWTSSDTSVATVSSNGYVKGYTDGTAIITATSEDSGKSISCEVIVQTADAVKAFVCRMYRVCLLREPDQGGLDYWIEELKSGRRSGAELVLGFYCSPEMVNRRLSNSEFMDRAYEGIMDRDPDPAGKAYWVDYLNQGVSYAYVVAGFTNSQEFTELCDKYGIVRGNYSAGEPRDQNPGVTGYVTRLYTKMQGRSYDADGLNYWCAMILDRPTKETLLNIALDGFMHSQEFLSKNLNDTEFVKVLYRTFLDREFEPGGLQYWVGMLQSGESRDDVAAGFAYSEEFNGIMSRFGF